LTTRKKQERESKRLDIVGLSCVVYNIFGIIADTHNVAAYESCYQHQLMTHNRFYWPSNCSYNYNGSLGIIIRLLLNCIYNGRWAMYCG